MRIHISQACKELLPPQYKAEERTDDPELAEKVYWLAQELLYVPLNNKSKAFCFRLEASAVTFYSRKMGVGRYKSASSRLSCPRTRRRPSWKTRSPKKGKTRLRKGLVSPLLLMRPRLAQAGPNSWPETAESSRTKKTSSTKKTAGLSSSPSSRPLTRQAGGSPPSPTSIAEASTSHQYVQLSSFSIPVNT